jgi:mRNA interferase RelE/StbE
MVWKVELTPAARRSLAKIDRQAAERILRFLTERAAKQSEPRELAIPLHGPENRGLWRYRIGDYRAIVRIENDVMTILVVEIGHRREIYK